MSRRRACSALAAALVGALASACASGPRLPLRSPPPMVRTSSAAAVTPDVAPVEVEWYGWQIIPIDVVAITAFVLGWVYDEPAVVGGSIALFGVGAPAVHLAHGDVYDAALSAGARVVGPGLIGGSVWLTREVLGDVRCGPERVRCLTDRPRTTGLVVGLTLAAIAPLLDAFDLAWKTEALPEAYPVVVPQGDQLHIGVGGRF